MAKKKTDWAVMVEYGKWLESFFSKELSVFDIKGLYKDALKIIGLQYEIPPNHPFFNLLLSLEEKNIGAIKPETIQELIDAGTEDNIEGSGEMIFYKQLYDMVHARENALEQLFMVAGVKNAPWDCLFIEQLETIDEDHPICQELRPHRIKIQALLKSYGGIGDYLRIIDNRIVQTKAFLSPDAIFSDSELWDDSPPHVFPVKKLTLLGGELYWYSVISRMLLDFLLLGGQQYCGFCKHCEKFFIAERKGRKKFCSDSCRTLNQRRPH
ncbi:MAG: hypothetical protein D3910_15260 [Candidatus Electrothrix sp. ATG2]|nr:hypothetical protein [Candidatus Electrothrix sp. ATG2]